MPTDKRARQRAARQARQAAVERRRQRRSTVRRGIVILVVLAAAVGIFAATRSSSKPAGSITTTTVRLAGDTTSANCPSPFAATTALQKPSFGSPPPMIIDPSKTYKAQVTTDVGTFTITLDAAKAPKTVNSFIFLAANHFYDCIVFHRVITSFMDQVGDPTGTGSGGPGYKFTDENLQGRYSRGEVAMANSGPNTNGSQFFVLVAPYSPPSGGYSLFGHVTSGQAVVDRINRDGSQGGVPQTLHRIISIAVSAH